MIFVGWILTNISGCDYFNNLLVVITYPL